MDHSLNSLNNFDFLARSFARMHAEGRPVDILAVTGNMDEEHRTWFCARYAWYCQQMMQTRELRIRTLILRAVWPVFVLLYSALSIGGIAGGD